MKTILYPGHFDPVHNGHIAIAKKALTSLKADRIIFIPCWKSSTNKNFSSSFYDRFQMIKLAIKTYSKFGISSVEKRIVGPSYTYLTINEWKKENPSDDIFLLIGSDQYDNFEKWKNIEEIRKNSTLVVYPRDDKTILKQNEKDVVLNGKFHEIASSSLIVKMEEDKINSEVLDYINQNGIYGFKRLSLYGMSNYRIIHSMHVAIIAKKIAKQFGSEIEKKAFVAGIYHDFCKEASRKLLKKVAEKKLGILKYKSPEVLHGPVGGYLVQKYFCFKDNEVIDAIKEHVILSDTNSILNKIIFCADKLAYRNKGNLKNRKMLFSIALENIDETYKLIKKQLDLIYKD